MMSMQDRPCAWLGLTLRSLSLRGVYAFCPPTDVVNTRRDLVGIQVFGTKAFLERCRGRGVPSLKQEMFGI